MTKGIKRAALVALSCAMLAGMGCEQADWTKPEYVTSQLTSPELTRVRTALGKVEQMRKDEQGPYVGALAKLYTDSELNETEKKTVMTILLAHATADAKDAYMSELRSNATGYGGAAAGVLGDLGEKSALPDMLKLLGDTKDPDTQVAILQAFTKMPDISMIPALTKFVGEDPDTTQIRLISYSCDILGDIAAEKPAALSSEAINTLVVATYKSNNAGQNVVRECGAAIQKLGQPANDALVKTFKGENADVQKLLLKYNTAAANFAFPPNLSEKRSGVMLAAMRSPAFPDLAAAQLDRTLERPKMLKGNSYQGWLQVELQKTSEQILALGDLGSVKHKDLLVKIMRGKMLEPWNLILDKNPTAQILVRQDAANALARTLDRSAAPELLAAIGDRVKKMEEVAEVMAKRGQAMAAVERYSFNVTTARAYGALAGADGKKGFEGLIAKTKEDGLKKELAKFLPMFDVAAECGAKGDDAAKAACYAGKLKSADETVREKAVFEIAMLPAAVAGPALAEAIKVDSPTTREIVELFVYRHPTKAAVGNIEAMLEKQKDSNDPAARIDNARLKALHAWLKHNVK